MICRNCGHQISDTAKFCSKCGTAVLIEEPSNPTCSNCGRECEADSLFCEECGTRLVTAGTDKTSNTLDTKTTYVSKNKGNTTNVENSQPANYTFYQSVSRPTGNSPAANTSYVLAFATMVSHYKGEKSVGVAESTGTLKVYSDRVELEKKFGNSAYGALGLIGLAHSAKKVKEDSKLVIPMNQILSARELAYVGVLPALVIELKNGEKHTFAGTVNKSSILNCINVINLNKK